MMEKTHLETKLTRQQQRSLFKWLGLIADALNEEGITLNEFLMPAIEVPATKENLHKTFLKQLIKNLHNEDSTTEIKKNKEIDQLIDIITLHCANNFQLNVPPFPSSEVQSLDKIYGPKNKTKSIH